MCPESIGDHLAGDWWRWLWPAQPRHLLWISVKYECIAECVAMGRLSWWCRELCEMVIPWAWWVCLVYCVAKVCCTVNMWMLLYIFLLFYWTYHSVPCCLCLFFVCLFIYLLCAVATAAVSYMTYLGDYWMTFTITSHRSLVGFPWLIKSDYSSSMKAILCFSHVTGFCLWNIWGLHSFCSVYHTKALKKDI